MSFFVTKQEINGHRLLEGDKALKSKFTGKVFARYSNGNSYYGEFKKGIKDGHGRYSWKSGEKYEGDFKDDLRNGYGTYYFKDGVKYEGNWANDLKHGQGIFYLNNGDRFEGIFKKDDIEHGIMYRHNGEILERKYANGECIEEIKLKDADLKYDDEEKENSISKFNSEGSEELLNKLNSLVGLNEVKESVTTLINLLKLQKVREENGLITSPITLHLVFTGNPGTGKTTVARLIAQIYKSIGLLKSGHFIETDRSDLVGQYVGETSQKVVARVNEALGGVLFIDEAYTLYKEDGNDFGQEAIDTLLKLMEDNRDDLVVIVAGYEKEMDKFLASNPGFKSRFKEFIRFKDYSANELVSIFNLLLKKNQLKLTDEAKESIKIYFNDIVNNKETNFSNGRFVRNTFEEVLRIQANRLSRENKINMNDIDVIQTITVDDINSLKSNYVL